jgi:hypothetical protein
MTLPSKKLINFDSKSFVTWTPLIGS